MVFILPTSKTQKSSLHALPISTNHQSSFHAFTHFNNATDLIHALPTAIIEIPHCPSSTVPSTTQNFNIVLSGHSSHRFITVLILHITHFHDSFTIPSHTVRSKDPQFSLHTLSSSSIHDFHTPHTVPQTCIFPSHSYSQFSYSIHCPVALSTILTFHLQSPFHTLYANSEHSTHTTVTFFMPRNAFVDTLAKTRQR
ncbi:hypothetical protein AVEN_94607-1 [Araneus ventricosus]|uniref:Uncharacterized protein n=1 Tax=Araneus ventricosus TaxID=182803 RepID=A0A4Y2SDE0_ARAVE|nr:hypothetical protein AVEN_94607-1 [Araneus ventricosus]